MENPKWSEAVFGVRPAVLVTLCGFTLIGSLGFTFAAHRPISDERIRHSESDWALASAQGIPLTSDTAGPVVVLFCAPGCGYCHQQVQTLATVAQSTSNKFRVLVRLLGVASVADTAGLGALFACDARPESDESCRFDWLDSAYLARDEAVARELGIVASPTMMMAGYTYAGTRSAVTIRRVLEGRREWRLRLMPSW
jgi:thiol-disulfide isomerase/thioredoxin